MSTREAERPLTSGRSQIKAVKSTLPGAWSVNRRQLAERFLDAAHRVMLDRLRWQLIICHLVGFPGVLAAGGLMAWHIRSVSTKVSHATAIATAAFYAAVLLGVVATLFWKAIDWASDLKAIRTVFDIQCRATWGMWW